MPPLHIELGLLKQYVKGLYKTGDYFQYLNEDFPRLRKGKIKEGVFVVPDIRQLTKNEKFGGGGMKSFEKDAWVSYKDVTHRNF